VSSGLVSSASSIMDGSQVPQQPLFAAASGEDPDAFSQFIDVEDFFQGDFYDNDIDYTQLLGVLNSQPGEDAPNGGDDAVPLSLSVGSFGDLTKATDYAQAGNGSTAPLMSQKVFKSSVDPLQDVLMIPPMVPLPASSSSGSRGGSTLFSNRRGGRAEPDAGGEDDDDDGDDDDDEDEYEGEGGRGRKTRRPQKKSRSDAQESMGGGTEKNRVERRFVLPFPTIFFC